MGARIEDDELIELQGVGTTRDGQMFEFRIAPDGSISRWGNTQEVLGSTVTATERIRDTMTTTPPASD